MAISDGSDGSDPCFILYGPSGSGIHTALKSFRELGYITLSGTPLREVSLLIEAMTANGQNLVIAPLLSSESISPTEAFTHLEALKAAHPRFKFLYLSTPTEALIQRYAAAEKKHPFEKSSIREAIEAEQLVYQALKPLSDYHIDTSTTNAKELGLKIAKILNHDIGIQPLSVTLTSFGFKHGLPLDAEMVFDMRFLPNPFYDADLKPLTGKDRAVVDYLFAYPETHAFLEQWQGLLAHTLPLYQKQGKTRLNIAIGCTGGQHRSVAMTEAVSEFLRKFFPDFEVSVVHREQQHWPKQTPLSSR